MKDNKLKDLLLAIKDDGLAAFLDSDNLPQIAKDLSQLFVPENVASIFGPMLGAVAPRANGVFLNYKQNRFERNVEEALIIMQDKLDILETKFNLLNKDLQLKFNGLYLGWLLDNLYSEKQEEKIPYHVNGYISFMENTTNDNLMLMFFDTLNQLTKLDIDVLNIYNIDSQENIVTLTKKYNLEQSQVKMIKEKLVRLGLLESKNDILRDDNLDLIAKYLKELESDNKRKTPKGVKLPNMKKPSTSPSYKITSLGRSYLLHIL